MTAVGAISDLLGKVRSTAACVQFGQMFPTLDRMHVSAGQMGAQMRLVGQGRSIAEFLGSSTGTRVAAMTGGRISQTVVAAASLDGGRLLPVLVTGDKPVSVRCAAVLMEVKPGIARAAAPRWRSPRFTRSPRCSLSSKRGKARTLTAIAS